jgi:hypothetical protein
MHWMMIEDLHSFVRDVLPPFLPNDVEYNPLSLRIDHLHQVLLVVSYLEDNHRNYIRLLLFLLRRMVDVHHWMTMHHS